MTTVDEVDGKQERNNKIKDQDGVTWKDYPY